MLKTLAILFIILQTNIAFANHLLTSTLPINETIKQPNTAALDIMNNALTLLKALKKQGQSSEDNINKLIHQKLISNIALNTATQLALKTHWHKLNSQQKNLFQNYISQSLIDTYLSILNTYDQLDGIHLSVASQPKYKDNKAIVKLLIRFKNNAKVTKVSLKMIYANQWRIYDVVFSGISIIKNFSAQFNSHIKRKGLASLISKVSQ